MDRQEQSWHRCGWVVVVCWLGLASSALAEATVANGTPGAPVKLTLSEALEQLRREGIETLYSSRLVTDDLVIERWPAPGGPQRRLLDLLAPLGLSAKAMPDGRWVVVSSTTGTVQGCLRSDPGGQPISGATLYLNDVQQAGRSDLGGCFQIDQVAAGAHSLEASRPGYVSRRRSLKVRPGVVHGVDLGLRIDVRGGDEILVSSMSQEPPLGTWQLDSERLASGRRSNPDVLNAVGELPGVLDEVGVAFGVRGQDSERLTLVVDGMDIVEPYHFRHFGSLAGAVTPTAVSEVRLHRGSPPLIYGNRAGGVLELVTASAGDVFSGRLNATGESQQVLVQGTSLGARSRWLGAARWGRPDIPREIAEVDALPSYVDGLAKFSATLSPRQDLSLQAMWARDDFTFRPADNYLLAADDPSPVLFAEQRSHHVGLRHVLSMAGRHLIESLVTDVEIDRRRFGYESEFSSVKPDNPRTYLLDDHRLTRRQGARLEGKFNPTARLDLLWGAASSQERTDYDTAGFAEFGFELGGLNRFVARLHERQRAVFGQGTWRPHSDVTILAGMRWDDSEQGKAAQWAPRASLSLRRGQAVWRGAWARVVSVPGTYELHLADGESVLPGAETTTYSSLGYLRSDASGHFAVEVHSQRISDPRPYFFNLYKPISRIPELEVDRLGVTPQAVRLQGVEVRLVREGAAWRGGVTYELSRSEDRIDDRWRPRQTDRRHRLKAWLAFDVAGDLRADLRWHAATGGPTTPFDIEGLVTDGFLGAVGEVHSQRLPTEHQLDLRLSRQWRWRGLAVTTEGGIDNLYDHRQVRGFGLSSLRAASTGLVPELGLGRRWRWGVELSW